ncbi:MAG: polyphosphate polymerase domain-containing protein [Balneolales bacterium]|nr:polyphosphate polymerase domain-containing protein [Balneolales bacterium]
MTDSKLQRQRFEYKYRISETKALALRQFVSSYMDLDSYGALQPDLSYPVHSLYLDSPNYQTYTDTINGNRNRYKLRVRYYENGENAPVYLEVKRRFDKVIAKKRAVVHRDAVQQLLDGQFPMHSHLTNPSPEQFEALQYFCDTQMRLNASPKTHIAYRREAYENDGNNSVRVTFDRHVYSEAVNNRIVTFNNVTDNPISVFGSEVILELKFTNRFPEWFKHIVQSYGLKQESAAKYVDGLIQLHHNQKLSLSHW